MAWAQRKGKRFERAVARLLGVRRRPQFSGAELPEVDLPDWWVECKKQRRPNIVAAFEQACRDCTKRAPERKPVAITQADRGPALATMELETFAELEAQASAGFKLAVALLQHDDDLEPPEPDPEAVIAMFGDTWAAYIELAQKVCKR